MNEITVSVCCLSYNHEDYIRQCLDGIVMQQTSFRFEVLVHDDASTDKSQQIILEYSQKYPDIIKPILQKENQYKKGEGILGKFLFPKCSGKYIAFCECDDYWTDNNKLQRQVDFLETNPIYVATADNGLVINSIQNKQHLFNTAPSHDVSMQEIITLRRFPTAGVLCKKDAFDGYVNACRIRFDTMQWCWLISKGLFRYEQIVSSVYRRGLQGITEYTEPYHFAQNVESWNLEILRVFKIDEEFIYINIARVYRFYTFQALKSLHLLSAIKCMVRSITFIYRAFISKMKKCYT